MRKRVGDETCVMALNFFLEIYWMCHIHKTMTVVYSVTCSKRKNEKKGIPSRNISISAYTASHDFLMRVANWVLIIFFVLFADQMI